MSYKWRGLLLFGFAWLVCFPTEVIGVLSQTKSGTIIWAVSAFLLVILSPIGGYYLGRWRKQVRVKEFHQMTENRFKY